MSDNYLSGKEAREKIILGAKKLVNEVAQTLGPAGCSFFSEHTLPPFYITSTDGVTLALAMELEDRYERIGANAVKEVARKADKLSKDGTTSACVLIGAILDEGIKFDIHPAKLKRELEACVPIVEESLKKQIKHIDVSEVAKVASISAGDETIGNMIQEIYEKIGKDGIIFNDTTRDFKDTYEIAKGVQITDCGFASPYMADLTETGQFTTMANLKNPAIIVTKQKITSKEDLASVGWLLEGRDLVIFADEVEGKAVDEFCYERIVVRGKRVTIIKLPIVYKDWWMEDIAQLTGATVIDPAVGLFLKDFTESMFGTCADVVTDKEQTFLNGTLDITPHLEKLTKQGDDDSLLRVARLNKKTAKYHVGAPTDTALKYRHDKVVDALGSAYQALNYGVVAGGGLALLNVIQELPNTIGGNILTFSLLSPMQKIINNAGSDIDLQKADSYSIGGDIGFNAKDGSICGMFEANIVDAYATVFNSFKIAVSVASTILTGRIATIIPKQKKIESVFNPYE